jgi:hypothetical protein
VIGLFWVPFVLTHRGIPAAVVCYRYPRGKGPQRLARPIIGLALGLPAVIEKPWTSLQLICMSSQGFGGKGGQQNHFYVAGFTVVSKPKAIEMLSRQAWTPYLKLRTAARVSTDQAPFTLSRGSARRNHDVPLRFSSDLANMR